MKIYYTITLIAIAIFGDIWLFNHVSAWLAILIPILITPLIINKIKKQKPDEKN
jgi:hypothetical protein